MIRIFRTIPLKKIKLILFDLDGTLIDSEQDLANSVNAMLRHFGRKELPLEVIDTYIGDGEHKLDNTRPYEGIAAALQQAEMFDGRARQMAVLTNKPVRASRDIIAGLGLSQYFFQTYGGNSFETKKPDPLGAQTLMTEAGATPGETVMVGDSEVDVLTARNANLWSIGVTYGFAPHTLEHTHPDMLVETPQELALALTVSSPPAHSGESPAVDIVD